MLIDVDMHAHACARMHACLPTSNISTTLIDVDVTSSDRNSREKQGVGSCPFDSCQRICMHVCVCVFLIEGLTEKMRMEKVEAIQENLEDSRSIRHIKVLLHVVHLYQGPNELGTCKPTAMWHADACPLTCPQMV
jgi:hypothetical protein